MTENFNSKDYQKELKDELLADSISRIVTLEKTSDSLKSIIDEDLLIEIDTNEDLENTISRFLLLKENNIHFKLFFDHKEGFDYDQELNNISFFEKSFNGLSAYEKIMKIALGLDFIEKDFSNYKKNLNR